MTNTSRWLLSALMVIIAVLVLLHFVPQSWSSTIHHQFNLDKEANVATWFSTALLLSVGECALLIHLAERGVGGLGGVSRFFWPVFAASYALLSLDEAARIHEMVSSVTNTKWLAIYCLPAAALIVFTIIHLQQHERNSRPVATLVIAGMLLSCAGGFGLELVDHLWQPSTIYVRQMLFAAEEGLELLGTSLVLVGCAEKLAVLVKDRQQQPI